MREHHADRAVTHLDAVDVTSWRVDRHLASARRHLRLVVSTARKQTDREEHGDNEPHDSNVREPTGSARLAPYEIVVGKEPPLRQNSLPSTSRITTLRYWFAIAGGKSSSHAIDAPSIRKRSTSASSSARRATEHPR